MLIFLLLILFLVMGIYIKVERISYKAQEIVSALEDVIYEIKYKQ